jgi:hypothetical protein
VTGSTGSFRLCGSKAAWLNGGLYVNVACTLPAHLDRTHEARISGLSRGQQQETVIVVRWTRPPDAKGRDPESIRAQARADHAAEADPNPVRRGPRTPGRDVTDEVLAETRVVDPTATGRSELPDGVA